MTCLFLIQKRWLGWVLLLMVWGFCLGLNRQWLSQMVSSRYEIREQFPPLVFVPGYEAGPRISASSGVLIEVQSGTVLYAKQAEQRRAPASTTKMMTAIVALEKGNLNQTIKISRKAAATGGSSLWLKAGEQISLDELLEGVMLRSGNDGSVAIAEGIAGSVTNFANLMNLKAKEIGALHTNFKNPHGLSAPSHYTTALDLALIARYGLEIPAFANLVREKTGFMEWNDRQRRMELKNTNRLLWYLEGADGVKTGTTSEAGHCLVASATRDGKQLVAVVLNSGDRWGDCAHLLEYGFSAFEMVTIAHSEQPLRHLKVINGVEKTVEVYPRRDLVVVVPKTGVNLIKVNLIALIPELMAPVYPGQRVGKIVYQFREEIVEEVDLVVRQRVRRKGWFNW